jgi:putative DNA primase/helicase
MTDATDVSASVALLVARLAALSDVEYDRARKGEAKIAGLRVGTLDDLVRDAQRAGREAARPVPESVADSVDGKPLIRCAAGKVDVLADEGEAALLLADANIFQRADNLVRPGYAVVTAADGRTTIAAGLYPVNEAALIEELTRVALWQKYDGRAKSFVKCDPPSLVARVLAARQGRWGLRPVSGVLTCPTLRPDGSILSEPGYDRATRLFFMPDPALQMPPIPERPSRADAKQAIEILDALLIDFKFVGEVDRAVALSLFVSSVVRGVLDMVPLHAFTAPTPGSGKSYLADITTAIISGRYCPVITPGRSEEELEKRLGAMVLAGYPTISLDNCSAELSW